MYGTDPACQCRSLPQPLNVTLTKSPVVAAYPLTYLQAFDQQPFEARLTAAMALIAFPVHDMLCQPSANVHALDLQPCMMRLTGSRAAASTAGPEKSILQRILTLAEMRLAARKGGVQVNR